ncbi:hypothetical protein [Pseudescherichia sp.]|uniref:hypothetical protein n=1 Tax=Pseudescherichia sp. TaxID=2055881 RepID=UPI00289C3D30|nr:hypothetical protein [Pseudescherichia sp.]
MRAFNNRQCDVFLNAFGQKIQTSTGGIFTGIVEVLPVSIDTGSNGFIESTETYVSIKKEVLETHNITIDSVLILSGERYVVYNIVDDKSGFVNCYIRTEAGHSFAEDY